MVGWLVGRLHPDSQAAGPKAMGSRRRRGGVREKARTKRGSDRSLSQVPYVAARANAHVNSSTLSSPQHPIWEFAKT